MQSEQHIFVSYSSHDQDFAIRLTTDLKAVGIKVWMAKLEGVGIQGGEDWIRALTIALNNAKGMITVLSPDYFRSRYCVDELGFAYRSSLNIFPILLRDIDAVPKDDKPFWVDQRQRFDFRDFQDPKVYSAEIRNLVQVLKDKLNLANALPSDTETSYLNALISELVSPKYKGILEYVELSIRAEKQAVRPKSHLYEWATGFSLLIKEDGLLANSLQETHDLMQIESFQQLISRVPRFVLIGEPGAGKTTTIRKLAFDSAHKRLNSRQSAPLPVIAYLSTWEEGKSFSEFIQSHLNLSGMNEESTAHILDNEDIVLFLDGLNEMGANGDTKLRELKAWLKSTSSSIQVILTCRERDYVNSLVLGLPLVRVEEMSEGQIRSFVAKYLSEQSTSAIMKHLLPENDDSYWLPDDQKQIFRERSLLRLARNPYLLTALIYIFENTEQSEFPRNFGALFKLLTSALWERERIRQTDGWVPLETLEIELSNLAFAMIDDDQPTTIQHDYVQEYISDETLLIAAHSATLVDLQEDGLRFYHQLNQEYFAAVKLSKLGVESRIAPPKLGVYGSRSATKWDEVVVALFGISDNPAEVLSKIAKVDTYLAARCISSGVHIDEKTKVRIIAACLIRENLRYTPGVLYLTFETLSAAQEAFAIPLILPFLQHPSYRIFTPASSALMKYGKEAIPFLIQELDDEDGTYRTRITAILAKIADEQAIPKLIEKLSDDGYDGWARPRCISFEAAKALKRIGSPEAIDAVENWQSDLIHKLIRHGSQVDKATIWAIHELLEELPLQNRISLLKFFDTTTLVELGRNRSWHAIELLKTVGTSDAINVIGGLLYDSECSYLARRALEAIGSSEALLALQSFEGDAKG